MKFADWLDSAVRAWPWYLLALILILADQWTKSLAVAGLDYGRPVEILPFFNLTLLHNTGAAFSFLADAGGWQRWVFSLLSASVSLLLLAWLPQQKSAWARLAMALILAGALGNLYDRILLGYVVDFISLHYGGWYFPAFNLADSCITLGAIALIIAWITEPEETS